MARPQRLKLTLKDRLDGREWTNQPREVTADPEDHAAIVEQMIEMARELTHRGQGEPWWIKQYAVRVRCLDEAWRDDFVVVGSEH